ncbi:MAG: hypothetical protein VX493_03160, partial [Candidatus Thermoplasmatota archaeon]|nr:hypothetical protein [Candidatus Thermoplasmatota archaeon]
GTLVFQHIIDNNGTFWERNFTVTFTDDVHTPDNPETEEEEEAETSGETDYAALLLIASLVGIMFILPRLMGTSEQE